MEARNLVTAREMVSEGTWLVPTMNGEIRIAKPPLPTWITTVVYIIIGGQSHEEGYLRIPAALMATLMVVSLWALMRGLSKDSMLPFICAAVLTTSLILLNLGRRNTWDIYSHSFMAAALWAFINGVRCSDRGWMWISFQVFGVLLAAAFMSKGPVPFYALLLPFMAAYGVSYGFGELKDRWRPLALGLLIFAALSSAWPLYLLKFHPDQIQQVFSQETAAWGSRHVRPLYFYLHFPLYVGIWFLGVLGGLWPGFGKRHIQAFLPYRFVLVWLIVTILLLSVIPEKKERYLLPASLPMAIMAGCLWRSLMREGRPRPGQRWEGRFLKLHAALLLLMALVALFLLIRSEMMPTDPRLIFALLRVGLFLGLLIPCYKLLRHPRASDLFVTTLLLSCAFTLFLVPAIATSQLYIRNYSYQPLSDARELESLHTYELYQAGRINMKDVWMVGKSIRSWAEIENRLDKAALPVVLMSEGNPGKYLPTEFTDQIQVESLGCFRSDYRHADKTKCFALVSPIERIPE
jgi:4-amino-4-deoxy-L-arabinose transferase-like glycosyltransferase